jgi:hypothetical protein
MICYFIIEREKCIIIKDGAFKACKEGIATLKKHDKPAFGGIVFSVILIMLLQFTMLSVEAQEITKDEIMEKLKKSGIKAYEVEFNPDEMYAFKTFSIQCDFFHLNMDEGYFIPGITEEGVTVLIFPNGGVLSVHPEKELAEKVEEDFGKAKLELAVKNAYIRLHPKDYPDIIGRNEIFKKRNDSVFQEALKLNQKKFDWYDHAWHLATFPTKGFIKFNLESDDFDYVQIYKGKNPSVTWLIDREQAQKKWIVHASRHFRTYFPENSPVKGEIENFAKARDEIYERVVDILRLNFKDIIDIYVYNSLKEGSRYRIVLNSAWPRDKEVHCALGGSFDHEIVHVMAYYIGDYRTEYGVIVEGLSEFLGKPEVNFDAIAASHLKNQSLIPLNDLIEKWDKQNSLISYPQAGSLVRLLIEEYGIERFKNLWVSKEKMNVTLSQIYDISIADLERRWWERLVLVKPVILSAKEESLLKSFVLQLDDILVKKDKSTIKTLTSKEIDEGIGRLTEVNLEKIFVLDPVEIQGMIKRIDLGSGSLISAEVDLKIKTKKDAVRKAKAEYIIMMKNGKCMLWAVRNLEFLE